MEQDITRYNVYCMECGAIWTPPVGSPLWWRAKKRAETYIDALAVSGEKCGCRPKRVQPEAPYRVLGYDDLCQDFDIPFTNMVDAAREYLLRARDGMYIVFFVGGSTKLHNRLYELEDE